MAALSDQEHVNQARVQALMPEHRVRPSLLQGVMGGAGAVLGLVTAALPRELHARVLGAVAELGAEVGNDALRELREAEQGRGQEQGGHAADSGHEQAGVQGGGSSGSGSCVPGEVREVVRALRDSERAPDGVPPVPGIITLQAEGLAGVGVAG
eukprot:CAMPEP_0202864716 /NCGR_PEP_ID=MMETSP1391-20130828/4846_1 /ASSEMBLY_ACC=CAM_ASM_000867 /TAXON_ID=1034604 /ORGANISM="Chlamydomonas leiostraca, Strain SAG 11-49" /LENGTH=153 /DNA_ID=CAMNT_0049544485 /DNA_START=153 /DNA_END=610 /DNA_ORIENTATION=+